MFDVITKLYDGLSDSTKRFEDRVLQATQLLGQCQNLWFVDLSKSLQPLMVSGDIPQTLELYSSFLHEQGRYQLPSSQAIALIHEAEARMKDKQIRSAMVRIRLGTYILFRWLDMGAPQYGCSFCYCSPTTQNTAYRFGNSVQTTWALLKNGNDFLIKEGIPLEEFLKREGKIALPDGITVSIEEIRMFLKGQMNAINSLLMEMAKDIGVIHARSDYMHKIDLSKPKRRPLSLAELQEEDNSGSQIYNLIARAERIWKIGLLTKRQEELTLGVSDFPQLQ